MIWAFPARVRAPSRSIWTATASRAAGMPSAQRSATPGTCRSPGAGRRAAATPSKVVRIAARIGRRALQRFPCRRRKGPAQPEHCVRRAVPPDPCRAVVGRFATAVGPRAVSFHPRDIEMPDLLTNLLRVVQCSATTSLGKPNLAGNKDETIDERQIRGDRHAGSGAAFRQRPGDPGGYFG
jgi:hypothetical protein